MGVNVDADAGPPDGPAAPAAGLGARLAGLRAAAAAARRSRTALNSARSLAANLGGLGLGFLISAVLTHTLGDTGYGIYAYAFSWANILLLGAKFQYDDSAIRYVAAYTATEEWSLFRGFLRFGTRFVLAASLSIAAIEALVVVVVPLDRPVRLALLASVITLPLLSILQFRAATLQGLKRVWEAQFPVLLLRPAAFAAAVGITWFVTGGRLSPALAVLLNNLALVIALALTTWHLRHALPDQARDVVPAMRAREWMHASLAFVFLAVVQTVLGAQSDVVIIGLLLTKADVAHYSVAVQLAMFVAIGVTAMMFVIIPQISALHARDDHAGLQRLVNRASVAALGLSVPVLIALAVLGPWLLSLFGRPFVAAQPVLLVLATGQTVVAGSGILAGYLMAMTGRQTQAGVIVGISAALYLVLSFVLTPRLGTVGTAIATSTAQVVRTVVLGVYLYRRCGISILPGLRAPAAAA